MHKRNRAKTIGKKYLTHKKNSLLRISTSGKIFGSEYAQAVKYLAQNGLPLKIIPYSEYGQGKNNWQKIAYP